MFRQRKKARTGIVVGGLFSVIAVGASGDC